MINEFVICQLNLLYKQHQAEIGVTRLIMEMKTKNKNRSHRYDIIRPRSRQGQKYNKYKKCRSMIVRLCIKQHLSNI